MSALPVPVPTEVPGEDIIFPPAAPVAAVSHIAVVTGSIPTTGAPKRRRRSWGRLSLVSAEHDTDPMPHDGWPDARPSWEDLGPEDHDEHRSDCPGLCAWCEDHRAWGDCSACGAHKETNDAGLSICCAAPAITGGPDDDGPERWIA